MTWHRRFFWLLIVFLPTQLGVHFWPDWAHVLGRRVDYLSPTLYFTDILVVITITTWFLSSRDRSDGVAISHFMRLLRFARNDKVRKARSVIITTLFFITVNVFFAANRPVAIYKWIKVGEFAMLGWYIVRTRPKLSAIILPLSIGILYSSVLAASQFLLQHSVGGPLWWLGERTFTVDTPGIARFDSCQLSAVSCQLFLRPYATFPHPNVLGGFLAAVLPLIISNFKFPISNQTKKFKIFKIITIVVGVIALFFTFSRSAIVVGAIAIAAAIARIKKHELRIMGIVLLVFILMSYVLRPTSTEESIVVRLQLNAAAVKLWQSSPFFGVGLGNFLVRLPEVLPTRTIYFLQPVHNIYLLILAEVGVAGGMLILWLTWVFVKKKFFLVFLVPLLTLLFLGLVDHYPLTLQQGHLLLTLLIAMSFR